MTIANVTTRGSRGNSTIILRANDYERLANLAHAARKLSPHLADQLADEVGRARVLAEGKYPQDIVCMNSKVEFSVMTRCTPRRRTFRSAKYRFSRRSARR